jgi:hypothetical protein
MDANAGFVGKIPVDVQQMMECDFTGFIGT